MRICNHATLTVKTAGKLKCLKYGILYCKSNPESHFSMALTPRQIFKYRLSVSLKLILYCLKCNIEPDADF